MCGARLLLIATLALAVSACATLGRATLAPRIDSAALEPAANDAIAGDLAGQLAIELGQGNSILLLDQDTSPFGASLDAALRQKGFAVGSGTQTVAGALALGYVVEPFERGVLVRLILPSLSLARLYQLEQGTAKPMGPLAVRRVEP